MIKSTLEDYNEEIKEFIIQAFNGTNADFGPFLIKGKMENPHQDLFPRGLIIMREDNPNKISLGFKLIQPFLAVKSSTFYFKIGKINQENDLEYHTPQSFIVALAALQYFNENQRELYYDENWEDRNSIDDV